MRYLGKKVYLSKKQVFRQMKKRIYISLPITGIDPELVARSNSAAKAYIKTQGHSPISPLEICEGIEGYANQMGKDIAALLDCDAVYFCRGWRHSRGCRAEYAIAEIYEKEILFE